MARSRVRVDHGSKPSEWAKDGRRRPHSELTGRATVQSRRSCRHKCAPTGQNRPSKALPVGIMKPIWGLKASIPYKQIHTPPPLWRFSSTWFICREQNGWPSIAASTRQINAKCYLHSTGCFSRIPGWQYLNFFATRFWKDSQHGWRRDGRMGHVIPTRWLHSDY